MSGYSSYLANEYADSINTFERFIELNPGHPDIAYAYYMIAISYYEQISDVERDQRMTREALISLEELVRRFPDSDYARDARLKIDLANDHLAGKNMEIGRWYQRRGDYLAARGVASPGRVLSRHRRLFRSPIRGRGPGP